LFGSLYLRDRVRVFPFLRFNLFEVQFRITVSTSLATMIVVLLSHTPSARKLQLRKPRSMPEYVFQPSWSSLRVRVSQSLVGGHSGPTSVPVPVQSPLARGQRRVSPAVMALQQNMYKLMGEGKFREAVKAFENFVNEGFREAEAMGLQRGLLPLPRRPAEYQWMQYIQALSRYVAGARCERVM